MKSVLLDPEYGTLHDIVKRGAEFPIVTLLKWIDADDAIDGTWTYVDGVPTPPADISLEDFKTASYAKLKGLRNRQIAQGATYDGSVFDSGERSIALLSAAISFFPVLEGTIIWRDQANADHEFSLSQLDSLGTVMFNAMEKAITSYWSLRDRVAEASDISGVEGVLAEAGLRVSRIRS